MRVCEYTSILGLSSISKAPNTAHHADKTSPSSVSLLTCSVQPDKIYLLRPGVVFIFSPRVYP